MTSIPTPVKFKSSSSSDDGFTGLNSSWLAALGDWIRMHGRTVQAVQWCVVATYAVLVVAPVFLGLPPEDAHWYDNLVVAAQWLFWGLWWPLVIASMFVLGRTWRGVFCPEGTLTEAASRHGLGVPRWMRWRG
jgi:polyferredoxin